MSNRTAPPLPEIICNGLKPGFVLVFSSNLTGIHGAGSALVARRYFKAQLGIGEGRTGKCYALPTKRTPYERMTIEELQGAVERFLSYARANQQENYLLVEVGCKLAGFTVAQVAPMFRPSLAMSNVFMPASFLRYLTQPPKQNGL